MIDMSLPAKKKGSFLRSFTVLKFIYFNQKLIGGTLEAFLIEEAQKPVSCFTFCHFGKENDICFLKEKKLIREKGFLFFALWWSTKGHGMFALVPRRPF